MAESTLCSWELVWITPTQIILGEPAIISCECSVNVPKPSMNTASPSAFLFFPQHFTASDFWKQEV